MPTWFGRRKQVPHAAQEADKAETHRGSHEASPRSDSNKNERGLEILHDGKEAQMDIVFVHGLTGSRRNTWTDKTSGVFWPETLLKQDVPKSRILTFGYDADVVNFLKQASQNNVHNHASNLINVLAQMRERSETNERPLIFVVHSLGGLVVENALTLSLNAAEPHLRQIMECTKGLCFLGTPHSGSGTADFAKILGNIVGVVKSTNTNLLGVLKRDSEVLEIIQNGFHTMLKARSSQKLSVPNITCFFEELNVTGVGAIVPKHSAILPGYNNMGIHNNHMDMTKFTSATDPGYLSVSTEIWRWAKEISSTAQKAAAPSESTQQERSAVQNRAPQPESNTYTEGGAPTPDFPRLGSPQTNYGAMNEYTTHADPSPYNPASPRPRSQQGDSYGQDQGSPPPPQDPRPNYGYAQQNNSSGYPQPQQGGHTFHGTMNNTGNAKMNFGQNMNAPTGGDNVISF